MTSSVSNSMGGGIQPLPLSLLTSMDMGARRKIFQSGAKPTTLKKLTVFRCAEAANEKFLRFCDISWSRLIDVKFRV